MTTTMKVKIQKWRLAVIWIGIRMRETRRWSVPKLYRYICLRRDTEFFYKTDIFVSGAVGQAYIFDGGGKGVN